MWRRVGHDDAERSGDAARSSRPSRLVVGYDREPDTLNRFSTHILEDIETCVVEGLVTTDEKMNIVPLLAASVPTLENGGVVLRQDGGMDVTWRLRPDVKWHDGTPHTSADVKFTVEAINSPAYNPESTDGFDRISSVDTPDPLTAVVHYREVYAPYALQFVRGTLPKHVLEGRDIDTRQRLQPRAARHRTVSRRRVEERRIHPARGGAELLARRRHAGDQDAALQVHRQHQHPHQPVEERRSGHGGDVPVGQASRGRGHPRRDGAPHQRQRLRARHAQPARNAGVRRRSRAPGADPRRRSRAHLDDDPRGAGAGHARPRAAGVVGTQPQRANLRASIPARARALLDEAGWRDTNGDGVRDKDGQRFAFTLITQAGFAVRENVAQVLQRQFKDVGVEAAVQLHDGTSISKLWFEGKFDAMLHWWQLPADPELTLFFAKDRMPPRGRNINYVADDALTALVYAADRTVVQSERKRILGEAQVRIADLAVEIPLYGVTKLDAVPTRLAWLHRQSHQHRALLERARVDADGTVTVGSSGNSRVRPLMRLAPDERPRPCRCCCWCPAIAFGLLQLVPGGPLEVYLSNPGVRPEDLERLRRALGLDRSLGEQYVSWLAAFVRGDWGFSFSDGRPVLDRIVERLPASIELLAASLVLALVGRHSGGHCRGRHASLPRRPLDFSGGSGRRVDPDLLAWPDAAAHVCDRPRLAPIVRPRRRRTLASRACSI